MNISWLRFEWNPDRLPPSGGDVPHPFVVRVAEKADEEVVQKVVSSALSLETGWSDVAKAMAEPLRKKIAQCFENERLRGVVLQHGSRIIGASVLDCSAESGNHLVTGPCIINEYRSRGHGSLMLYHSLALLRETGISPVYGLTRAGTTLARFVYVKYGATSIPWTPEFDTSSRLAA